MAGGGFLPMKLKRKDLDQVNDDFSDFSLSSPARKIRRLDADLPPIMEEEEHALPEKLAYGGVVTGTELNSVPVNHERAIVLFNPANSPLYYSPSDVSVSVDPLVISEFKNEFLRSACSDEGKSVDDDETSRYKQKNRISNGCLAVVPWVPSQFPYTQSTEMSQTETPELMEADEVGEATMDIEEDNNATLPLQNAYEFGGMSGNEGLQWPQQHCMMPLPPQNTSTPITWFQ